MIKKIGKEHGTMEFYDDEYLDNFLSIKFIGMGTAGASASDYFSEVGNDFFPERLIVSNEDADLRVKILDFIARVDWLFVIMDIEDLELAEKVAKIIEKTKTSFDYQFPLITFLILCPSTEDVRLADIPKSFCTWIILPKDKIAETDLTSNELIYRIISVNASLVLTVNVSEIHSLEDVKKISLRSRFERNYVIGLDILDVMDTIKNFGRACIGFGKSLDAENNFLAAVKNALQSPLFIEEIGKAKKVLLVFVVKKRREFVNMLQINEAANFLLKLFNPDPENVFAILWQTLIDETFGDSVTAFVLATNFEK